jgi:hypothetical protein
LWLTTPFVSDAVARQISGRRLLPASVDGQGEVWVVDAGAEDPQVSRSVDAGPWRQVTFPPVAGRLTGFRVSVDGTRVAVVVRPVELTLVDVSALSWAGADRLVVVGGTRGSALEPTTVFVDGTVEPVTGISLASVKEITAAPNQLILAGTAENEIAEYVETGWRTVGRGRDPAYPG